MKLYEYAIIYKGKKDKNGEWTSKPELLAKTETLATDETQAGIVAARQIPETHLEELDRIDIVVRPF